MIIGLGYKGLFITTFDPEYATTLGISVAGWHYLLMSSVSVTTVFTFESVGAILVVAFLIIPAATAYLLTHKLKTMLLGHTHRDHFIHSGILPGTMAQRFDLRQYGRCTGVLFIAALAVSRGKRMQISAFS